MTWILGSSKKDLLAFYAPGLLMALFTFLYTLSEESTLFFILAFICLGFFDSGHVYTTIWRTYLNPKEFKRTPRYYLIFPLAVFLFFFLWIYFKIPYLGAFIAYFTIYHNLRQFYGMNKWYQKVNKSFDKVSDKFLYLLCVLPVVIAHFRSNLQWTGYYEGAGVFIYPSYFYENLLKIVYLCFIGAWVGCEYYKSHKIKKWEIPRILAASYPVALYSYCFLYAETIAGILFPLVLSHGLSYIVLIQYSTEKLDLFQSSKKMLGVILLSALVFGGVEFYLEEVLYSLYPVSVALICLSAFVLTPLFCHYAFDAFLWRSDHPESKTIMS